MNVKLKKQIYSVVGVNTVKFILVSLIFSISLRFVFNNAILYIFKVEDAFANPIVDNQSIYKNLFISILAAPIVETFIFFSIPHKILESVKKKFPSLYLNSVFIGISALLFGLNHTFNAVYFFTSMFGGVIMAFFYLLSIIRKDNPYWNTVILHSLYNLFVFLVKHF